jgi:hydrogenase maturation factor HypE
MFSVTFSGIAVVVVIISLDIVRASVVGVTGGNAVVGDDVVAAVPVISVIDSSPSTFLDMQFIS